MDNHRREDIEGSIGWIQIPHCYITLPLEDRSGASSLKLIVGARRDQAFAVCSDDGDHSRLSRVKREVSPTPGF
jgi:hypothetical protein